MPDVISREVSGKYLGRFGVANPGRKVSIWQFNRATQGAMLGPLR